MQQTSDLVRDWHALVDRFNADSAFANNLEGAKARAVLVARWLEECPGLPLPDYGFDREQGKYVLRLGNA